MLAHGIIGKNEGLYKAVTRAMQAAPFNVSVLVLGESGTGKDVIPRIIHSQGPRKHKAYLSLNCASIPEHLIDSALFGHVKGAFTGANNDQNGYFEEADGGTLFLDELGEMPLATQAKLLRVLENHEIIKLGAAIPKRVDVRVIAATNRDLATLVGEGKFREDLYYRLSAIEIKIPSLKERGADDIKMLVRWFSRKFRDSHSNISPNTRFKPEALDALAAHSWPGNVRELKNIVERILVFENGNEVDADKVKQYLPQEIVKHGGVAFPPVPGGHGKMEYERERALIWASIKQIGDELKQLKAQLGEIHNIPAFANSNLTDLQRDVTAPISIDDSITIESGNATETMQTKHIKEVATDVETIKTLDETERETIKEALNRNHGKRRKTAVELNISERTLYRKIKEYNL